MAIAGEITWQHVLFPNHLKLNGQQVTASDYPELLSFVTTNHLNVSAADYTENKVMYVYDQANDLLTLPDFIGKTVWGVQSDPSELEAGLPNVRGAIGAIPQQALEMPQNWQNSSTFAIIPADGAATGALMFDASSNNAIYGNSETVQPPAAGLIPQVAYVTSVAVQTTDSNQNTVTTPVS